MATLWAGRARGAGEAERMSLDTFLQELEVDKRQPRGTGLARPESVHAQWLGLGPGIPSCLSFPRAPSFFPVRMTEELRSCPGVNATAPLSQFSTFHTAPEKSLARQAL